MTRQSLWPSYDHSDLAQKIEKKDNMRKTNGNICQCKGRAKPKKGEKKGSTLLSVARYVLDNRLDKTLLCPGQISGGLLEEQKGPVQILKAI